jgi:hypothetical protein
MTAELSGELYALIYSLKAMYGCSHRTSLCYFLGKSKTVQMLAG